MIYQRPSERTLDTVMGEVISKTLKREIALSERA